MCVSSSTIYASTAEESFIAAVIYDNINKNKELCEPLHHRAFYFFLDLTNPASSPVT